MNHVCNEIYSYISGMSTTGWKLGCCSTPEINVLSGATIRSSVLHWHRPDASQPRPTRTR